MQLYNILGREEGELIKRVYKDQTESLTKGDFIDLVKKDLEMIGEPFDEEGIISQSQS